MQSNYRNVKIYNERKITFKQIWIESFSVILKRF